MHVYQKLIFLKSTLMVRLKISWSIMISGVGKIYGITLCMFHNLFYTTAQAYPVQHLLICWMVHNTLRIVSSHLDQTVDYPQH